MNRYYNNVSESRFFGGPLLPFAGGLLIGGLLPYPGRPTYNNNNYQQSPMYYQPTPYYVTPTVPYYVGNSPYTYQQTYQTNNVYYKTNPTVNTNPYYSTYVK